MLKKALALLLAIAAILSISAPALSLTSHYEDISGHWAEDVIDRWSLNGVISGFGGKFMPNAYITRGDLSIVISRMMNYKTISDKEFSDAGSATKEQLDAMLKLCAAGVLKGDSQKLRPMDLITREEACVLIGRAMRVEESPTSTVAFHDMAQISDWAKGMVMSMSDKKYFQGSGDGYFNPKSNITRAEVMKAIDNIIVTGYFNTPGTYTYSYLGNVIVNNAGIELKTATITGDLIITEGVGNGNITLTDITVEGTTYILGGGNIILQGNTRLGTVSNERTSNKTVQMKGSHSTIVENLTISPGSTPMKFEGAIRNLNIKAPNYKLTLVNSMIINLVADSYECELDTDANTFISNLTAEQTLKVSGKGRITNALVRPAGDGSTFETQPQKTTFSTKTTVFLGGNAYYNDTDGSKTVVIPTDSQPPGLTEYTLTKTAVTPDSITFSWQPAVDNVTKQADIRYILFYSTSNFMNSVEDIEKNGIPAMPYTKNKLTGTISRLKSGTTYYFNVIAIDDVGNKTCYEQASMVIEHDGGAPQILNPAITVTNIKPNQLTLNWQEAIDDITPSSKLIYSVFVSETGNLNNVAMCEQFGKQFGKDTPGITTMTVTGLKENTSYYFNIVVTDETGNKSCYTMVQAVPIKDVVPPAVGTGVITATNHSDTGVLLTWTPAADNATEAAKLKYTLYQSREDNIQTLEQVLANGKVVKAATAGMLSWAITNQKGGIYYYNVLVADEAGNKAVYPFIRLVFGADTTPPAIPTPATLTVSDITEDAATLTWLPADDTKNGVVGSSPQNLVYTLYAGNASVTSKNGSNFKTVNNIVANGSPVSGAESLRGITTFRLRSQLTNSRTYYNVIVTDESGRTSCYAPTLVIMDPNPPFVSDSMDGLTITADETYKRFTIKWNPASDLGTPAANLSYSIYMSPVDLISAHGGMQNKVDAVLSGATHLKTAKGMKSHTQSNILFDQNYFFYVICTDDAGNGFLYGANEVNSGYAVLTDNTPPNPGGVFSVRTTPNDLGGASVTFNIPKATDNRVPSNQIIYYLFASNTEQYNGNRPEDVFDMYRNNKCIDVLGSNGNGAMGITSAYVGTHQIDQTTYYYLIYSDGYGNFSMSPMVTARVS